MQGVSSSHVVDNHSAGFDLLHQHWSSRLDRTIATLDGYIVLDIIRPHHTLNIFPTLTQGS